jgi:diaminopimelate decarboxylase
VDEAEEISLIDEAGVERQFRLHDAFDLDESVYYLVEAVDDPEVVSLLRERSGTLESVEGAEFDRVLRLLEDES